MKVDNAREVMQSLLDKTDLGYSDETIWDALATVLAALDAYREAVGKTSLIRCHDRVPLEHGPCGTCWAKEALARFP